jgi:membrane protein
MQPISYPILWIRPWRAGHDPITSADTPQAAQDSGVAAPHPGEMSDAPDDAPTTVAPSDAPEPGGAWATTKRTLARAWDDNIFSESAAAAFWQTLSLPPLLLGLLGSLGYIGSWFAPNTLDLVRDEIVHVASGVFSGDAVNQVIAPTVDSILTTGRSELVSLGFVISLWSGSSAMSSFVDAITRAHDQYGVRNPIWQRTLALLLYVVGLVAGIVALPLLALGPDRITALLPDSWRDDATSLIGWLYYPVLGVGLVLALTTLYRLALPAKPPWRRGLPGALLAAVVFLVGVTGLRVYLNAITTTGYTYGALAAPIAFLLAAFFIGFAVVIGAHLNASIQHFHPVPLKDRRGVVEQRAPRREPDTVALPATPRPTET